MISDLCILRVWSVARKSGLTEPLGAGLRLAECSEVEWWFPSYVKQGFYGIAENLHAWRSGGGSSYHYRQYAEASHWLKSDALRCDDSRQDYRFNLIPPLLSVHTKAFSFVMVRLLTHVRTRETMDPLLDAYLYSVSCAK
jgi:hypothetical protein